MDALGPLPALPPVRRTPSSDHAPDERHRSGTLPGSVPEPLPRRTLPQQALLDALASRLPAEPAARRAEPQQRPAPPAAPVPPPSPSSAPLDRAAALLRTRPDPTILIYERPTPGRAAPATQVAVNRHEPLPQLLGELAAQTPRSTPRTELLSKTRDASPSPSPGTGLTRARQLIEAGRPGEALDLLDQLDPAPQPRTASWHLARAAAWQQLQRPQEAAREASAALARTGVDAPTRHAALQQLGQALTLQGETAEAAWCHRTRLAEHPRDSGAALQAASAAATEADWPALAQDLSRLEQTLQPHRHPHPLQPQHGRRSGPPPIRRCSPPSPTIRHDCARRPNRRCRRAWVGASSAARHGAALHGRPAAGCAWACCWARCPPARPRPGRSSRC